MRRLATCVLFGCLVLGVAGSAKAEVKLARVFGEHMVLQRDIKVPVWGTATAGEEVSVIFNGQTVKAKADEHGRWKAILEPMAAGGPFEMTVQAGNTLSLKDVLVGEVWVASGQSNMEWVVKNSRDSGEEIKTAEFPQIRMFTVKKKVSMEPLTDCEGTWQVCSPQTVSAFSAVGYFFARDLHAQLKVPVGVIHTSWGGTPAQAWTRKETLANDPDLKTYVERLEKALLEYPKIKADFDEKMKSWVEADKKAKEAKEKSPPKPRGPMGPDHPHSAAGLYNGMIAPLIPYAIKGAIWYQGESNAGEADRYAKLFPALIRNWREDWAQGDFPFLFVQLAGYMKRMDQPTDDDWPRLRESQTKTLALPNTGMAVAIDIGEENDIHPKNKQDVGKRLALAARKVAYGEELVFSGPLYEKAEFADGAVRVSFTHVGGGLTAKDGDTVKGFSVAGEDKKWVWAQAKIDGSGVLVSSPEVATPVAVRYAWANTPDANLYNKEGLPAVPFRSDDWPKAAPPPKPKPDAPPAAKTAEPKTGQPAESKTDEAPKPVKPPAPPTE
ncbi:MAG: 9-O-acetylesterase [Planctomycetota bacterium]